VLAVVAASAAVRAQAADTDDLIAEGVKLRKADRDQEALRLFQQAYAQKATPRASGQLGLCEHAVGLWVEAEKHLDEALSQRADAWVAKNESTLRRDLVTVRANLGSIDVWGSPAGATIAVDGHAAGTLPLASPIRAVIGRHTIAVEAPGHHPSSVVVDLGAGALIRRHVELATLSLEPAGSGTGQPPARRQGTDAVLVGPGGAAAAGEGGSAPLYKRWWFWTAIAAAVVAGGATVYLVTRSSCPAASGARCFEW
jgi:hypothetical protein